MVKEYKLKLNNKKYNIEIEEQISQKEELTFEKFQDEWENIGNMIFLKKSQIYFVITGLFLISFIISYIFKFEFKFNKITNKLIYLFFTKTYLIVIIILEILLILGYWYIYIPKKLEKIINNTENNEELKEKLEKIFKEKTKVKGFKKNSNQNRGINEKVFNFYKLLIKEKFVISKEENYKKILDKLSDSIDSINKKSSTIVGYISNNFIKSFCGAMIMANVNAFYCAYYSNVKDLSYENFIKNIVFFVCMIGLGIMLNYFIMDYYKPTIKEIEKKKKCIESIWKEN